MELNAPVTSNNRDKLDTFLLLISGSIFILSASYLFFDIARFWRQALGNSNGVAVIDFKENVVKGKKEDSLAWEDSSPQDSLFNNQQIFTGDESNAKVIFKDGNVIKLQENTLVKLVVDEDRTRLDLSYGMMQAQASSGTKALEIKAGGQIIRAESNGAELQVSSGDNGSKITVKKGEVKLNTNDGKQLILKEEDVLKTSETGESKIVKLAIVPKYPPEVTPIYTSTRANVPFKWEAKKQFEQYEVIVSEDSDFKKVIFKKSTNEPEVVISQIPPGNYFWKVVAKSSVYKDVQVNVPGDRKRKIKPSVKTIKQKIGEELEEGSISTFVIVQDATPEIIYPQNESKIFHVQKSKETSAPVVLEWGKTSAQDKFEIEVFKGNEKVASEKVDSNKFILEQSKSGNYRWRVRSLTSKSQNWSEFNNFDLKIAPPEQKVDLVYPKENVKLVFSPKDKNSIDLTWKEHPINSYMVTVSKDPDFKDVVYRNKVDENKLSLPMQKLMPFNGKFYWKVAPYTEEGEVAENVSSPKPFEVEASSPQVTYPHNGEEIVFAKKTHEIKFAWEDYAKIVPQGHHESFDLEVARDPNFKEPLFKKTVTGASYAWQTEEFGTFYWRVRVSVKSDDKENKELLVTPYSAPTSFEMRKPGPPDEIDIPDEMEVDIKFKEGFLRAPKREGRFPAAAETDFVDLSFPTKNINRDVIKKFVVEIYADDDLKNKVFSTEITSNRFRWENPIPGIFFMRVAMVDVWGQQGKFGKLSKLKINLKKKALNRPVLLAPRINHRQDWDDVTHNQTSLQFSWRPVEGAASYILEVAHDRDFSQIVFNQEVKSTQFEISSAEWKKTGKFYWRIVAKPSNHRFEPTPSKKRIFELLSQSQMNDDLAEAKEAEERAKIPKFSLLANDEKVKRNYAFPFLTYFFRSGSVQYKNSLNVETSQNINYGVGGRFNRLINLKEKPHQAGLTFHWNSVNYFNSRGNEFDVGAYLIKDNWFTYFYTYLMAELQRYTFPDYVSRQVVVRNVDFLWLGTGLEASGNLWRKYFDMGLLFYVSPYSRMSTVNLSGAPTAGFKIRPYMEHRFWKDRLDMQIFLEDLRTIGDVKIHTLSGGFHLGHKF